MKDGYEADQSYAGWMVHVKVALGNRGMTVETERLWAEDRKE